MIPTLNTIGLHEEPRADRERDEFSPYQNELYKRAVFGLNYYTASEKSQMHWEKRKRINKVQQKSQKIINCLKQAAINHMAIEILQDFFPEACKDQYNMIHMIMEGAPTSDVDPDITVSIEFKTLGITKKLIADNLIANKILSKDFYLVKENPNPVKKLPKLKGEQKDIPKYTPGNKTSISEYTVMGMGASEESGI